MVVVFCVVFVYFLVMCVCGGGGVIVFHSLLLFRTRKLICR